MLKRIFSSFEDNKAKKVDGDPSASNVPVKGIFINKIEEIPGIFEDKVNDIIL